jgi:hypothetical protein
MKRALACAAALVVIALLLWPRPEEPAKPPAQPEAAAAAPEPAPVPRAVAASPAGFTRMAAAFAAHAARVEPGRALLDALVHERSPQAALKLARELARKEDDPALLGETVAALRDAPEARQVGLLALLGRGDRSALQLAADTLAGRGDAETRATAAFVLHNAPVDALPDQAYAAAREALRDRSAGARLREEAATLLGRPDAPASDVGLLEQVALDDAPAVSMRALAALDFAADPRMGDLCDRIAADSAAPDRLVQMARAWRAAHP